MPCNCSCCHFNMGLIANATQEAVQDTGYSELRDYQRKTIEAVAYSDFVARCSAASGPKRKLASPVFKCKTPEKTSEIDNAQV